MDETIAQATEIGYTQTLMKRKRYLPDLKSKIVRCERRQGELQSTLLFRVAQQI